MKILKIAVVFLFALTIINAQEINKAGTSAAQFLKIGTGAKEVSMAGATAALVDNVNSMFWNPAGLVNVNRITVGVNYTNWFADLKHNFFGIVFPISDDQTIGVSATVLSMGKMEITNELQPKGTGEFFEASDATVGITYSARLVEFFSFGGTIKYITQNIYNESASAIAIDLGTKLNTGFMGLKIGMSFTNFGSKLKLEGRDLQKTYDPNPNSASNTGVKSNLETQQWELPLNFRVGIGWDIIGPYDAMNHSNMHRLKFAVDANHPNDAPENLAVGADYTWNNLLSIRSGYHINDDVRKLVMGFGIIWQIPNSVKFEIDYAYQNLVKLGDVHTFGIQIGF